MVAMYDVLLPIYWSFVINGLELQYISDNVFCKVSLGPTATNTVVVY